MLGGHKWKLKVKRNRLKPRKCSFSQQVRNSWNKLPEDVPSVSSFKKRLDDSLEDVEV